MPTIALEMERLRSPYSGLGQYCLQLGHAYAKAMGGNAGLHFACLVPAERKGEFGHGMTYKSVKLWIRNICREVVKRPWLLPFMT
jgi:hypothetical protein